ncbi:hypothetical protein PCC7418_1907 [Halothece sp. PCC 7418]|uniref:hypothetical protein n=1 Tax=Halothece sp. (strain PCC 7418) TaxID=65093 RepID=UPI0002A07ECF|nr:hypothetical protein [Halothece sp. PCC 7418]AFZ44075.1 hypothetical protein PCC7418_1907 [Halothece sp. PCC 7418]
MSVEHTNQNTRILAKDVWKVEGETDWEKVRAMTDEDINAAIADDPDTIDTDETFWEDAVASPPLTFLDQEEQS